MNAKQIAAISAALNLANGKRRGRLADVDTVLDLVRRVAAGADGTGIRRTCGTVANSYTYRAPATVITAVRVGDTVRVRIEEGNAVKIAGGGRGWQEGSKSLSISELLTADLSIVRKCPIAAIPLASAKRTAAKKAA